MRIGEPDDYFYKIELPFILPILVYRDIHCTFITVEVIIFIDVMHNMHWNYSAIVLALVHWFNV